MQQKQTAAVLDPLSDAQFMALRLWAMSFGTFRPVGVAVWPFHYSDTQRQRLKAIVDVIPQRTRLLWVSFVAVIWFVVGFAIGFLPLTPLIAANLSGGSGVVRQVLLPAGVFGNLVSAYYLGSIIATWIGGRMLNVLMTLPPLDHAAGDAELLSRIRRQIRWTAIFGVLSAAEPTLVGFLLRS